MNTIKFDVPDLTKMIQDTLANHFSEEKLKEIVDKCCSEVIEYAIKKQFEWGGDVREKIIKHVKDTINIDTKLLPVPEYTNLVAEGFKNALAGMEDEKIKEYAEELMKSILQSAPREIKLTEIVEMYTDELTDKYNFELRDNDKEADYDGDRVYKSYELSYGIEERFPDSSCLSEHKIITLQCYDIKDDEHRLLLCLRVKDGIAVLDEAMRDKKYSHNIGKMEMKDWSSASELSQMLYKMIHRGTKIIMDEDEVPDYFEIELEAEYN